LEYASPRLREVDVWLWIVEDRRAEQVFELVQKLQPDYAVSKSHYVPAPAEGVYTTLKDKKTKVLSLLCLYFVFKANLLKDPSHPLTRMEKLFQVRDGMGASKSLYDEAKYAMYPADELRMEFYLRIMRALTRRGDAIFNIFGGTKPIFVGMVSSRAPLDELVSVARPKLAVLIVWVARPKLAVPIVWVARPKL
jgi:hypothetical protein